MNARLELNSRGTLTIPKAMRRLLGIKHGGRIIAETSEQGILLRPGVAFPGHLFGKTINGTLIVPATVLADELSRKGWIA